MKNLIKSSDTKQKKKIEVQGYLGGSKIKAELSANLGLSLKRLTQSLTQQTSELLWTLVSLPLSYFLSSSLQES